MQETKHTPGPWKTDGITIYANAAQSGMVADCRAQMSGTRANARLITAAPELLEALEELVEYCAAYVVEWDELGNQRMTIARAAIARAKGVDRG